MMSLNGGSSQNLGAADSRERAVALEALAFQWLDPMRGMR